MDPAIQWFQGDLIVRTQMEEGAEWVSMVSEIDQFHT
jgi:hypothetical protein